ncbi:MAG TPA: oxygenase MpaB family protein [Polyangiales bacterium]
MPLIPQKQSDSSGTSRQTPERAPSYATAKRKWIPDFIARLIFGKPLAPTQEEWKEVVDALWEGDPEMDRLVDWMFSDKPGKAKALFEQALLHGIETVEDPPAPLKDFFDHVDRDPEWLDRSLLDDGARGAQLAGMAGFYVMRDMALMGGYVYFNAMNQTLAATGALSRDVRLRLGETGKWVADVTTVQGLNRFSPGFLTTIRVRMVHALVRRSVRLKPSWDANTWGLPINQIDMLATYLAFGPVAIMGARVFGVPVTKRDAAASMHMWRYIGWLMGVQQKWLAVTEGDGLRKLYHAYLTHRRPDDKVRQFGIALRDEPLKGRFPWLKGHPILLKLWRRYTYHKHISNSSLILGPIQRYRLGMPMFAVPWYPILSAPFRFLRLGWYRLRGGKPYQQLLERSLHTQQQLLASYFENGEVDIIRPTAEHPAHVGG